MKDEDVIALIVVVVIGLVSLAIYIGLVVLGVQIAKRKNRSPHWMWFALHPTGLVITLIVLACLSPLRICPRCGQKGSSTAPLCAYCGWAFPLYPH